MQTTTICEGCANELARWENDCGECAVASERVAAELDALVGVVRALRKSATMRRNQLGHEVRIALNVAEKSLKAAGWDLNEVDNPE